MISPQVFQRHGLDAESLRKHFEMANLSVADDGEMAGKKRKKGEAKETGESDGVRRLRDLFRSRIQEGRSANLRDYRDYAAVDYAYEAAYHQTTPTLVRHLCGQKLSYEESLKAAKDWGMGWDSCFRRNVDGTGATVMGLDGQPTYTVNAASLVRTMIPMVKSYVTVRTAKLYTDRDQVPLFKFEPLRDTVKNRLMCEILNHVIEGMATQFGYRAELKDIILHTLLYGICMTFPQEAWFKEEQEQEDGKTLTVKAGLRYLQPHPTRMFYDLMHRTSSLNSDSGCQYAGHWRVVRYADVMNNPAYYNRAAISVGTNWFDNTYAGAYFSDFYPCTIQFPVAPQTFAEGRESRAAFYSTADADKAVFLTDLFCKLVPKDYGLGDYKHPVWFRFVMASDDTVVYAEPLAYPPAVYFGYDPDGNRVRNPSMGLELVPHQDLISNLLSQMLLTAKQNLMNVTFYDRNLVKTKQIESLQNSGELAFRGINLIEFDGEVNAMSGNRQAEAFHTITLPKSSIQELVQALNTQISICERMLSFSAQELGSAASHQQSKAEIVTIAGSVGVRVAYTGTFIDDGIEAWKRQMAAAAMAYMEPEFVALVSPETPDLKQHLEELGFTLEDEGGGHVKAKVRAKKEALVPLLLEGLASTSDGPKRHTDQAASQVMMQTWQAIANNPMLAQEVGAETILQGMEEAAKLGGATDDFELTPRGRGITEAVDPGQALQQAAQQIQQGAVEEAVKQSAELMAEQVAKPAAERMAQLNQEVAAVAEGAAQTQVALQRLTEIVEAALSAPPVPQPQTYDGLVSSGIPTAVGPGAALPPEVAYPV